MWRIQTTQDILTALIHNPDWFVLFIEVCGVVYFIHQVNLAVHKVKRAMFSVKLILMIFVFSAIVYALWNYLYINGVNPFTGAVMEGYNGYVITE